MQALNAVLAMLSESFLEEGVGLVASRLARTSSVHRRVVRIRTAHDARPTLPDFGVGRGVRRLAACLNQEIREAGASS